MKTKVLLSSILTIALCLSLIAGSTFALFTADSSVGIVVTAGEVDIEASLSVLELYSVKPTPGGKIVDENGGTYEFEGPLANFANGGTATIDKTTGVLTLDCVTPGDKVKFGINVQNDSDVTIQYRYKVEYDRNNLSADRDAELMMSGLMVTVEGTTYPVLEAFTSKWVELKPGTDVENIPVVIELPVTADNKFQGLTTYIKVTVEAVQGNADVTSLSTVAFLDGFTIDLGEKTIVDAIANKNNIEIKNGTIEVTEVGVENYGNLTLTDITIGSGTAGYVAYGYGLIGRGEESVTELNGVHLVSANGALATVNGATLIFNDGYLEVDSKNTSGRYHFYVAGEGSKTIINGGEFYFNKTQNQKRAYAYVDAGATLEINGGNFGTASSRDGYTAGLLGEGTIIIKGGIFGFDPTKWVAPGYTTLTNGSQWYVVPAGMDAVVKSAAELQDALNNGKTGIYVAADIVGDVTVAQSPDTKITIEGNGHKFAGVLLVDGKSGTYTTAGLTVKNFVFVADAISADACIQLGKDNNTRYTCNVTIEGCTFDVADAVGVKSYTGGDKNVSIINCVATEKAHSLAQLKGVDGVLVKECEVNSIRGINLNNSDNVVITETDFDVQKYAIRFGESANSIIEQFQVLNCNVKSQNVDNDAAIILRAGAKDANLDLTGTVIEAKIEIAR